MPKKLKTFSIEIEENIFMHIRFEKEKINLKIAWRISKDLIYTRKPKKSYFSIRNINNTTLGVISSLIAKKILIKAICSFNYDYE